MRHLIGLEIHVTGRTKGRVYRGIISYSTFSEVSKFFIPKVLKTNMSIRYRQIRQNLKYLTFFIFVYQKQKQKQFKYL